MILCSGRRTLCSAAALRRWHRSSSHLSSFSPQRSPISRYPSPNSSWVRVKIAGLEWVRARGEQRYCSASSGTHRCWSCGRVSGPGLFLVCESCMAVQPVDTSVDYFQIFGIERGFDIEEGSLETKYKEWQKKLHPDLVHTKSEREKSYAVGQSARVIDAYRTLSRTLSRASYLLELEGVQMDEEGTLSDPELLTEVLEIREAVEEAKDTKALEKIRSQIQEKMNSCLNIFAEEFARRKFDNAVNVVKRMIYYEKALQEIVIKI